MERYYERYEYGYRTEQTGDAWPIDYGPDGSWIPALPEIGMAHIDMYGGDEADAIRRQLEVAGVDGVVIRREIIIAYGEVEEV